MKICPVCGARAFDDAPVCYGCLHRFAEEVRGRAQHAAPSASRVAPPSFRITISPARAASGEVEWTCNVQTETARSPAAA